MKILQVTLDQVDKIFNPNLLDMITTPQGIGKNTERYWILNTEKQTRIDLVNRFLFAAKVNQFTSIMINKKAPN